jgi:Legume lectin domain
MCPWVKPSLTGVFYAARTNIVWERGLFGTPAPTIYQRDIRQNQVDAGIDEAWKNQAADKVLAAEGLEVMRKLNEWNVRLLIVVGVASLGLLSVANAQVINYPSGFTSANLGNNPGQIYPNNASYLSGTSIQIGDATGHRVNNTWYTTPVNVQAFTTTFTFHVNCSANPSDCGDGLGFMMLAADSANPAYNPPSDNGFTYSGFSGGQFSWSQCDSPFELGNGCPALPAMLVKFDLYNNVTDAAGANETGLYTGGEYPQAPENPQYDMFGSGINMQSGDEFKATLVYNGATLVETVTDTVTKAHYTQTYAGVNLPSVIGANTSLVGFGAGTGAAELLVYIDSWTYIVESVTPPAASYNGCNTDLHPRGRSLYLSAVGEHLGCHLGRNHLLHDQRNDADYVLDPVHWPDYGELDGDAGGDSSNHGGHQQRGCVRCIHPKLDRCGLPNDLYSFASGVRPARDIADRLHHHIEPVDGLTN